MTDTTAELSGVDDFDKLVKLAAKQEETAPVNGDTQAEIDRVFDYRPLPVELPSGWHFREWKQKHVMALYEHDGFMLEEKRNRFRRNYEVVKAAIECDCFDKPTAVQPDILLDMDMRDVEQLHNAVSANFMNVVNTPKN